MESQIEKRPSLSPEGAKAARMSITLDEAQQKTVDSSVATIHAHFRESRAPYDWNTSFTEVVASRIADLLEMDGWIVDVRQTVDFDYKLTVTTPSLARGA
jgi:hypothetical protein